MITWGAEVSTAVQRFQQLQWRDPFGTLRHPISTRKNDCALEARSRKCATGNRHDQTAVAIGLILFFAGAIINHLRACDYSFGLAVIFLLLAVAALALRLASS
jgi:hypothetical protein